MTSKRLLDSETIPTTLWDAASELLILPESLAATYEKIIDANALRNLAASRDPRSPPVGGMTQDDANKHFAQAFDGSAARVQLAFLDPKNELPNASDTFVRALAGNTVCLTDSPCGAGAAAFAFLTTVAELRSKEVLPREPLDVKLIAADLSAPSRSYAERLYQDLQEKLEEQAIFVEAKFREWDVTDAVSNTDLIQEMLYSSPSGMKRILVVANFNAFLESSGNRRLAERQLEELFRHASGPNCSAIWIEPNMNRATNSNGTFNWIATRVRDKWKKFMRLFRDLRADELPHSTSTARFREPLAPTETPRVNVAILPLSLERN